MRIILLLCSFVFSTHLSAKPLEIYSFEFPPYIMENEAGQPEGIIIDLIDQAMAAAGIEVEYKISNWARAYRTVSHHEGDALIPTMRTPDRELVFHYPDTAFLLLDQHLIALKSSDLTHFNGDFAELDDWRIGKVRGVKISPTFDIAQKNKVFDVEKYNSVSSLVRSLLIDRLDVIATDSRQARYVATQNNQANKLRLLKPELGAVPVYLAFSRQQVSADTVQAFDNALHKLLEEGALALAEQKYLEK